VFRFVALMLALTGVVPSWASGERLPVWQVQGGSAEIVILGSMHMIYPGIYPLRDEIQDAFKRADALVVEVDVGGDNALEMQQMMMRKGMLQAGDTLQRYLSPRTMEQLHEYLDDRGLDPAMFTSLHPGFLMTRLSSMRMEELGLQADLGIDRHFLDLARGEKDLLELESVEQQLDLLLGFPDHDLLMVHTLSQLSDIEKTITPLYLAWKNGDAEELNRLLLEDEQRRNPRLKPVYDMMFDERNIQMAGKICAMLETRGSYFIVVGAGHLVGEKGIIALLQKAGYQAQRL